MPGPCHICLILLVLLFSWFTY